MSQVELVTLTKQELADLAYAAWRRGHEAGFREGKAEGVSQARDMADDWRSTKVRPTLILDVISGEVES